MSRFEELISTVSRYQTLAAENYTRVRSLAEELRAGLCAHIGMKDGVCVKCGHHEVIEAKAADYAEDSIEREMSVTAEPRWVMGGRNPRYPHGVLYTYTCRSCGFTEWYARNPSSVPIGPKFKTKLIGKPRRQEAEEPRPLDGRPSRLFTS